MHNVSVRFTGNAGGVSTPQKTGASSGGEGDGVLSLLLSASRDLVVAGRNSGAYMQMLQDM